MASFTKESHYANVTASSRELRFEELPMFVQDIVNFARFLGIIRFSFEEFESKQQANMCH